MLYQESADRARALEALEVRALAGQPGDILRHEELRDITGVEAKTIYDLVRRLNRDLAKAGRWLISVRRVGYKLATPTEKLAHANGRRLRSMRQQKLGVTVLGTINRAQLTEADRQTADRMLDKMSQALSYLHWNSQRTTILAQKTLLQSRKTEKAQEEAEAILDQIRKFLG